jgi:hypothetical protein
MNAQRKQSVRREMLGCAREARYERANGDAAIAATWAQKAAQCLYQLGGLLGNW